ncbi:hypothetical protein BDV93DRAFT_573649 [Ceratobasidium sp. AG-I]|nr:hypothetical protein BDV93DRAFT_573649 [Ceratobasidium sp. AG-I]
MSIPKGSYYIISAKNRSNYAGTGPLPPTDSPIPAPLKGVESTLRDLFQIEISTDRTYTIKTHDLYIGLIEDYHLISLLPKGKPFPKWSIESGSGPGRYRLKIVDSDQYWTFSGQNNAFIEFKGLNGEPDQEWHFSSPDNF